MQLMKVCKFRSALFSSFYIRSPVSDSVSVSTDILANLFFDYSSKSILFRAEDNSDTINKLLLTNVLLTFPYIAFTKLLLAIRFHEQIFSLCFSFTTGLVGNAKILINRR